MAVSVTGLTADLALAIAGHMAQTETFATSPEIKSLSQRACMYVNMLLFYDILC
jgi:hypothetical protein